MLVTRGGVVNKRSNSNDKDIDWLVSEGKQRRKNSSSLLCCVQVVLHNSDAF